MRHVVPSGALTRRSRTVLYGSAVFMLVGLFVFVIGFLLHVVALVVSSNPGFAQYDLVRKGLMVIGGLIIVISVGVIARALSWKRDNLVAKTLGDTIAEFYDDRFVFIRNVSRSTLPYMDAVLVGPPGVLVLRVTDARGIYFNEGRKWMRQKDKGDWHTMRWNPTEEAVSDIKAMREWLKARNLPDIPVFGGIVFTREVPELQVTAQNPVVPVLHTSEFSYSLQDNYFVKDRLEQQTVCRIASLLYE
jgi:hypothetical protein